MPVLDNYRHERFAQAVAQGMTAAGAMGAAGFKTNNATTTGARLLARVEVADRVEEIKLERGLASPILPHHKSAADLQPVDPSPEWIEQRFVRVYEASLAANDRPNQLKALTELGKIRGLYVERSMTIKSPLEGMTASQVALLLRAIETVERGGQVVVAGSPANDLPPVIEGTAEEVTAPEPEPPDA